MFANRSCRRTGVWLWLLAAASWTGAVSAAEAEPAEPTRSEWPQFRGPNRDGVAVGVGLLGPWPEAGPPQLWRVPVGAGYSGVSSAGDQIYTMWQEAGSQFLFCLEAATGEQRWRYRVGPAYANQYGDGPRSTPVVHREVVFAVGARGHLHAVRGRDGQRLWSHDLKRLGARIPASGYASTPIVEDGRLIVEIGGEESAFVAFETTTGQVAWRSGSDLAAYSSPIAVSIGGQRQIVFFSGGGLHAVAPEDGRILWDYPWLSLCPATGVPLNAASPIHVPPDRIFISSGYGDDQGAAVIRLTRQDDRFQVETVWRKDVLNSQINSAILLGGHLYGFRGGVLKSVDVATGEERWRARGFQRGSVIAAGGRLLVLGERGRLALVEETPEAYVELGSVHVLKGRSWTPPSVARGRLYVRNHEELVCLDLSEQQAADASM